MGMPGQRVLTAEEFTGALKTAFSKPGPYLIDAIVPNEYSGVKLKALPYVLGAINKIPSPVAKMIKRKFSP